jgi:hypothetical protein
VAFLRMAEANLGFLNVGSGTQKRDIPLKEAAAKGMGISFVS